MSSGNCSSLSKDMFFSQFINAELQEENDLEAFNERLFQRPSYRNEKCSETASERAAIGQGSFLSMAVSETRHATRKETINVPGTSLKDATTAKNTGDELSLSLLAGRPSKSGPSDWLAYSAALQMQEKSSDDEVLNRMNEIVVKCLVLSEIEGVTEEACQILGLPGAQFWSPCNKQIPKYGCRLSDENQNDCYHVCRRLLKNFPTDSRICDFYRACREDGHLIQGEGVVGKAFATNELWFSTDISSMPKTDYPLSEYARMFGLRSAVAVPLHIIYLNQTINFVYEFFLPFNCTDLEEQRKTLAALIFALQQGVEKIRKTISRFHFLELRLVLKPVNSVEYSLAYIESSSIPEENLRGPPSDRSLLPEPSNQNNQCPDQTPSIKQTEVFDDAIGQGSFISMAVNETSHGTGEKTINVPVRGLKDATVKETGGKSTRSVGSKRDWAWQYCSTIEGNSNGVICSFCGLEIKGGGITRFKSHIYDLDPCKNVKKCKNMSLEERAEVEKRMKGGYNKKK